MVAYLRKVDQVRVNKRAKFEETGVSGMDLALDDDDGDAEGPTSHPLGFHIENDYISGSCCSRLCFTTRGLQNSFKKWHQWPLEKTSPYG